MRGSGDHQALYHGRDLAEVIIWQYEEEEAAIVELKQIETLTRYGVRVEGEGSEVKKQPAILLSAAIESLARLGRRKPAEPQFLYTSISPLHYHCSLMPSTHLNYTAALRLKCLFV